MAVSSTTNRVTYSGNGTSTSFSFPYYFFLTTDLVVYLWDTVALQATLQVLGTNYTVSGTPNSVGVYTSGANIVFSVAPASTVNVVIVRRPQLTSNYTLSQNAQISSLALTQQMDYLTLLVQSLEDQILRAPTLPDGYSPNFSGVMPSTTVVSPNGYVQVNSTGTGYTISPSPATGTTFGYAAFSASSTTSSQTLLTLPASAMLENLVIKHSVAFGGTGITDVKAGIGVSGDLSCFIDGFDVFQAVGDQVFDAVKLGYIASWANSTPIYLTLTSSGANLNALTTGSLFCYYSYKIV